jgi:hypothetical protein
MLLLDLNRFTRAAGCLRCVAPKVLSAGTFIWQIECPDWTPAPRCRGGVAMTTLFPFLADAEAFLRSKGFHLIPHSSDWTNAAGDDAGVYAIYGRYGQIMGWRVELGREGGST